MNRITEQVDALLAGPRPLPVVTAGHPVLRQPAALFDGQLDDSRLADLVSAMRETMLAAPGVGLAAPQIGIGLQIAVLEDPAPLPPDLAESRDRWPLPFEVLINPDYRPVGEARAAFYEGCLSVPGFQAVVERPARVHLTGLDQQGATVEREYRGWQARIVQHETDHLRGILYLDKAALRSITDLAHYQTRWAGGSIEPARRTLGF